MAQAIEEHIISITWRRWLQRIRENLADFLDSPPWADSRTGSRRNRRSRSLARTFHPKLEWLEIRLAPSITPTEVQAGALSFRPVGGTFTQSGHTATTNVVVQVGFTPSAGKAFTPLVSLNGQTSIDDVALTLSSTGTESAIISGTPIALLNGFTSQSIAALTGTGITGLSGRSFTAAGNTFSLTSFAFSPSGASGQPQVQLQGSLALPIGLTVSVTGSNFVDISSSGVKLTGLDVALPSSTRYNVAGVTFATQNVNVRYAAANDTFTLTGSASFNVPTSGGNSIAGTVQLGGTTAGLVIQKGKLSVVDATGSFTNTRLAGAVFNASNLHFGYRAAAGATPEQVTAKGTGTLAFGSGRTLTLTIGNLAISGGVLKTLSGSASISNATIAGATLNASITFGYAAAVGTTPEQVTASGTGTLTFGSNQSVSLAINDLAIKGGVLSTLTLAVTGNVTVAGLAFTAKALQAKYVAAGTGTSEMTLVGKATPEGESGER